MFLPISVCILMLHLNIVTVVDFNCKWILLYPKLSEHLNLTHKYNLDLTHKYILSEIFFL